VNVLHDGSVSCLPQLIQFVVAKHHGSFEQVLVERVDVTTDACTDRLPSTSDDIDMVAEEVGIGVAVLPRSTQRLLGRILLAIQHEHQLNTLSLPNDTELAALDRLEATITS